MNGGHQLWRSVRTRSSAYQLFRPGRELSSVKPSTSISPVLSLPSWDLEQFKDEAFKPAKPVWLPRDVENLPPACPKWFIHANDSCASVGSEPSELRTSFWSEHEDTMVPLELTSNSTKDSTFHRTEAAPLKLLLAYLGDAASPASASLQMQQQQQQHSIYLAQCELSSLPASMQADLPTPNLVLSAGKGDIYSSSLWLGRPPTYTPLHRDPNPNLFLQLAGQKVVRLFPPDVGKAIFDSVQEDLQMKGVATKHVAQSANIRGEEMMQGSERRLLHDAVWPDDDDKEQLKGTFMRYAQETRVGPGEALFIPKGYWHSVKGVGVGITASANWWFR